MPSLDPPAVSAAKADVIRQFGEWTNHNLRLAEGVYTIAPRATASEPKLRRVTQIATDWLGEDLTGMRVLDLACLEGMYGLELALRGARLVGIEGREASLSKARFAREALGIENAEFHRDDVRNLSPEKYGEFDLVLCVGICYHLDAPDVFRFLEQVGAVCRRVAIVDTHVSLSAQTRHEHGGLTLWGCDYREHDPGTTPEQREEALWASLDNPSSFWLTRPSLFSLLQHCGFSSVYECHSPLVWKYEQMRRAGSHDRATFVAVKRPPVTLRVSDLSHGQALPVWPEVETPTR